MLLYIGQRNPHLNEKNISQKISIIIWQEEQTPGPGLFYEECYNMSNGMPLYSTNSAGLKMISTSPVEVAPWH